jgi:putative membrane protein
MRQERVRGSVYSGRFVAVPALNPASTPTAASAAGMPQTFTLGAYDYDRGMSFWRRLAIGWLVDSLALAAAALIFSGVWGSAVAIIGAALVFGLLSSFVKPVLKFLTFPFALVTLGIAWFFVAMFILWLTSAIVSGFHIDGFWTLVGATIVVWAVGGLASLVLFPRKRDKKK